MKQEKNFAYVDGQNLYMGTTKNKPSWTIDLARFRLYYKEKFDKIVLVSGDGDYKMLVDLLIKEDKFKKILFPNLKFRSSLYKQLSNKYFTSLDDLGIKNKIEKKKRVP